MKSSIIACFYDENKTNGNPSKMMQNLLGKFSFYKVMKSNRTLKMHSFNFDGGSRFV